MYRRIGSALLRLLHAVEGLMNVLANICIFAMMFLIFVDVFARYVFNSPIKGAYETCVSLMVGMVFFGVAYTQAKKGNIAILILVSRLSSRMRTILNIVIWVLCLGLCVLITWQAGRLAFEAWRLGDYTAGAVRLPVWPAKSVISLGAGVLCLTLVADIVHEIGLLFASTTKPSIRQE